jgi:solute carrier family 25 phosphate transporter 23/24/25/41
LFTHPFDVVRRKLQVVGIGGGEREYEGAIDCIRKISRKEGFWRGM